jgi:hypothetical protein
LPSPNVFPGLLVAALRRAKWTRSCGLILKVKSTKHFLYSNYRSRALKSRSKLRAAILLRAAFVKFLLNQNSSLCTVTFREKVLTLAKSRGS